MFIDNIEKLTIGNENYRQVISTNEKMQLVLMSLKPKEQIGMEIHPNTDQFIRIEKGTGKLIHGKDKDNLTEEKLEDGTAMIIPMNTWHNVINVDDKEPLKLYTVYSPPQHTDKLVQKDKPIEGGGFYHKYLKYKNKYIKTKRTN